MLRSALHPPFVAAHSPSCHSAGGKFTDRKRQKKEIKKKKTTVVLCHISSLADCTSTCRSDTEAHAKLNCTSTKRKSGAKSAKPWLNIIERGDPGVIKDGNV